MKQKKVDDRQFPHIPNQLKEVYDNSFIIDHSIYSNLGSIASVKSTMFCFDQKMQKNPEDNFFNTLPSLCHSDGEASLLGTFTNGSLMFSGVGQSNDFPDILAPIFNNSLPRKIHTYISGLDANN